MCQSTDNKVNYDDDMVMEMISLYDKSCPIMTVTAMMELMIMIMITISQNSKQTTMNYNNQYCCPIMPIIILMTKINKSK